MSNISLKFATGVALLALLAAIVDHSDACAPTSSGGGAATTAAPTTVAKRRRRSTEEEDVHVFVLSKEQFDLARNEKNMEKLEQKLKKFAEKAGIPLRNLNNVEKAAENVGGRFGVHFEVGGAVNRCSRVVQFIQAAVNSLDELVSGTVKCGSFEAVHVTKKQH